MLPEMNDQALLNQIRQGDKDAYDKMFVRFYSPLCEYASQYVTDADAEELVQNLMVHIWKSRECLEVEKSLKSYLFVSVRNRCYNTIRNRQSRERVHSAIYEKIKDRFEDPDYYMADEMAANIEKAIEELPETYRETFKMSRFGEMPNAEIANLLGVSVKTVEYRITQSLKILCVKLKDYLPVMTFLL